MLGNPARGSFRGSWDRNRRSDLVSPEVEQQEANDGKSHGTEAEPRDPAAQAAEIGDYLVVRVKGS
jgi:hypothetical protein